MGLISRLALLPRPASEIGVAQQTCGSTCRARKLAALRTVHQGSTAGLTRRLVTHLLVFKERYFLRATQNMGCIMRRTKSASSANLRFREQKKARIICGLGEGRR